MADVRRERTGIDDLDEILSGGFPAHSTILLIGPPGVGKSTFLNQFIYTGIADDEKGLYLTLDDSPEQVVENAEYFGMTFDPDGENFLFIDGYSWREGDDVSDRFAIEGPSDLNQMNMTLADALSELGNGPKRITLDSVSTLVLYTDPNSAVKFLQVVGAKSKASDSSLLMTLEEGVHDDQTISTLNYVADGVIRMRMKGDNRYMSISRMEKTSHTREWLGYQITDGGIELTGDREENLE